MPMGKLKGTTLSPSFCSTSSKRSKASFPSLSSLLINTIMGMLRIRQTSTSFSVCSSTPLATSITTITLSTAVSVLKVSSAKSLCPGVSRMLIFLSLYRNAKTEVATEIPLCRSISIKSEVAPFLILLLFTAPASWMAPPKRSSFSVRVVFPASGWEMIPKVLLLLISCVRLIWKN